MDHPLTPAGYQSLVKELHNLETVRRSEIARRLKQAREFGDITESAEYETAKRDQAMVEGRIKELHELLGGAEILHRAAPLDHADVGMRVTVKDLDTNEESEHFLVSPLEARLHNGGLSVGSPVGEALVERRVGDVVYVDTPKGERQLEIIALQDETAG